MGLLKKIKMKIAVALSFVIAFTGTRMPYPDDIGGDDGGSNSGGSGGGNNCHARHRYYDRAFCFTPYDRDGVSGRTRMWERGSACRPVLHYTSSWRGLEENTDYKVELCGRRGCRELCSFTNNWYGHSTCTNRIPHFEIADGDEICLSDATGAEISRCTVGVF